MSQDRVPGPGAFVKTFWISLTCAILLVPAIPAQPTVFDDDAGSGSDAGDWPESALHIEPGTYSGRLLAPLDVYDAYAFDAVEGQGISVAMDQVRVYAPYMELLSPSGEWYYPWYGEAEFSEIATETGTWTVEFYTFSTRPATDYTFTLDVVDLPPQDDAGSGRDAGRTRAKAAPIATGAWNAQMTRFDDRDVFAFQAQAGSVVEVRMETSEIYWGFYVLGPNDYEVSYDYVDSNTRRYHPTITGEQLLVAYGYGEEGAYSFTLGGAGNETPPPPPPGAPANDIRLGAASIGLGSTTQSNAGANTEAGDDVGWCGAESTIWFVYKTDHDAILTIETTSTASQSVMVFEGATTYATACATGDSPGSPTRMTLGVSAGQDYFIRAGTLYGEDASFTVNLSEAPHVDLAVRIVGVERGPLKTDFGNVPNVANEKRIVVVEVANEGPDALPWGLLDVRASPGTCEGGSPPYPVSSLTPDSLGGGSLEGLAPGEVRTYRLTWDTTDDLGDQRITATAFAWYVSEDDPEDNDACLNDFVRLGGAGGFL